MRRLGLAMIVLAGCLSGGGRASSPAPGDGEATPVVTPVATPELAIAEPEARPTAAASATATHHDPIDVTCARALRCGSIGRSQLEECRKGPGVSRLTLVWGYDDKLGIPALVAAGRLKSVPGNEQTCLEFLSRAPCRIDRTQAPPGCHRVPSFNLLAPGVPPGGKCTRWDECIDGFCTAQTACEGVCKAAAKLGEACGSEQICGEGGFCWDGVCQARAGVGAECGGHWQWCQEGLFCDGYQPAIDNDHDRRPARNGRCSAGKAIGEPCVPPQTAGDGICAPGLYCDWGLAAPLCQAPKIAGDECRSDDACADGLQCMGLLLGGFHPAGRRYAVRRPGRCTPTLDAGDACEPRAFVSGCPGSMRCDDQTRLCRSRGHSGDPCESSWITKPQPDDQPLRNNGCFSSHYCEVATRTCQPQRARGERCTPQKFGVEDEPCFLGKCDAKQRRCVVECSE